MLWKHICYNHSPSVSLFNSAESVWLQCASASSPRTVWIGRYFPNVRAGFHRWVLAIRANVFTYRYGGKCVDSYLWGLRLSTSPGEVRGLLRRDHFLVEREIVKLNLEKALHKRYWLMLAQN